MYGTVCSPASRLPTMASHETRWGSRLYLLMGIFTLYGILPCARTAVTHPSLPGNTLLTLHMFFICYRNEIFILKLISIYLPNADDLRLLSHNAVCNRGHTRSGAVNFSRLNNPMGSFTHAMYGTVCSPASRLPTMASHKTRWGSRLYLLMGIFTLYGILPCARTAVIHPLLPGNTLLTLHMFFICYRNEIFILQLI